MEFVSGIKLRDILLDNGNWWRFFLNHKRLIRTSIITNVLKVLVCRTIFLGYHLFACTRCNKSIKVPHSCKSRFCSSCGKKATDAWIQNNINTLPDTTWQHITFTMPSVLWDFFWANRHLSNKVPPLAANIIKKLAQGKGFTPGIYLAIHTFGRDLKRNFHIHLSTTSGGLSPSHDRWIKHSYWPYDTLQKMWKYEIISLFRNEYKAQRLTLPPGLKHLKIYQSFTSWLDHLYQKSWVVHLNKPSHSLKVNVEYFGRYLKRPPLGETRIKKYHDGYVTYEFLDHYTGKTELMTLPVLDFIARLIAHIPDRYFRNIRYYGFLANRLRGRLLPLVYRLLDIPEKIGQSVQTTWRKMIQQTFGRDPLQCPQCGLIMQRLGMKLPEKVALTSKHQEIAHGSFPLL